jgi:hypothetical protein
VVNRFVQTYHVALAEYEQAMLFDNEYPSRPASPREEMLATLAAGKNEHGHSGFSIELPDGILSWDEQLITRFIESAMRGTKSEADGTATPPLEKAYGRPSPYPRPASLASKRGIGGVATMKNLKLGSWRGTDYAASWVESQLALGNVIEL